MVADYLDFQALVGITKHTVGRTATRDLLAMCRVDRARDVLEVGCGIGVGAAGLVSEHGCRVVAIDRSDRMIEWARRRVREAGVEDRVELVVASVTDLPFADARFDLVYAESVLAFVDDPGHAIREMVRVTRPGGYVGISESIWTAPITPELEALARDLKAGIGTPVEWRSRMLAAGLEDVEVRLRRIDPAAEVRNRIRWVGIPWAIRAWARTVRLLATDPSARARIRGYYGAGMRTFDAMGYGLFAGRVPANE